MAEEPRQNIWHFFTRKLLKSNVAQHGKRHFSSFTEFVCFGVCTQQ